MKRLLLPLLFAFLFIPITTNASHYLGGEISWTCLSNGKYVFHLKVYRECAGINHNYTNEFLQIIGNPLPRTATNSILSSILLRPDSGRWISSGYGDLSPDCDSTTNPPILCANGNYTVQQFFYSSDPIELRGTPPAQGWSFYITGVCCRATMQNLAGNGSMVYKSVMYHNPANGICDNSSPQFAEVPRIFACRGLSTAYPESAFDLEGDSLSYHLDATYNAPISAPQMVPYDSGYSASSPTPGLLIDSTNIPYSYDPISGKVSFRVNNGMGIRSYFIVRRIDEYRDSVLISSVYRELPLYVRDCPQLDNVRTNDPPRIAQPFFNGVTFTDRDTVEAGNAINMNLSVLDTNTHFGNSQDITIEILSDRITDNYSLSGNCFYSSDTSCAYIPLSNATYNAKRDVYQIKATRSFNGQIFWQTDCSDLSASMGPKTHYFYISAKDDLCPIPAEGNAIFEITVMPPSNPPCQMVTNIEDSKELEEMISIYPNPTNGLINIDRSMDDDLQLDVFDLQGRKVDSKVLLPSERQLQLPEAKGVYLLRMNDGEGRQASFKVMNK